MKSYFCSMILFFVSWISSVSASVRDNLKTDLDAMVHDPILKHASVGICVYSITNEESVYHLNELQNLIPASLTKLFTTSAALHHMGSHFTFATSLYLDGMMQSEDTFLGNLIIKGDGDPTLSFNFYDNPHEIFEKWTFLLLERGITHIQGDLIGDDTAFDSNLWGPGWAWDDIPYIYSAPISPLSFRCYHIPFNISRYTNFHPSRLFMEEFRKVLEMHGIHIQGETRSIKNSSKHHLYSSALLVDTFYSPPLLSIIRWTNKQSDNFCAEMIYKKMGSLIQKSPGSFENGQSAVISFLQEHNIDTTSLNLVDGSGLSRMNFISAKTIVELLSKMYQSPYKDCFIDSLAIPGDLGTLRHRLVNEMANGKACRAKTGSMGHINCLAGYLLKENGEVVCFAILVNHYHGDKKSIIEIIDKMCNAIYTNGAIPK